MCRYVSIADHDFDTELVATIRSKISSDVVDSSLSADAMDVAWSVSARIRQEIKAGPDSGIYNDIIGIAGFVRDWRL